MKKLQLFIILLVVLVLLAVTDFAINVPEGIDLPSSPSPSQTDTSVDEPGAMVAKEHPNLTKAIIESSELAGTYRIEKRTRTTQLFEVFDIKPVPNISVYNNIVINEIETELPINIYEVHGPAGQGKITYLNIKLQLIDQLGTAAAINETGQYGFNSLWYNDEANANTGFLLSHIGDNVFGFKFSKNSGNGFDIVKKFVETHLAQVSN